VRSCGVASSGHEKIRSGIWDYNGVFHLVDSWTERDAHRTVCKFKLIAVGGDEDFTQAAHANAEGGTSLTVLIVEPLGRKAWPDSAALAEPHNGFWGGR
jgi:hypothetical protein